ncbi:MAG TPA: DUF1836 domain-containing protein [Rectinemataceae bacterium]|nr:DUF1836 domain-containing protein [Rectinemataceae bacterium]
MDDSNRKTMGDYFAALALKAPADWEHLPDIGLYMDQVITYLERQLDIFRKPGEDQLITPSMINNYAKAKIIPRTEGKKYGQEHIALLLSVFTLKRVLSVQDMGALFDGLGGAEETREFYEHFRQSMEYSANETATEVRAGLLDPLGGGEGGEPLIGNQKFDEKALRNLSLKLAVEASLRSFAAEKLLSLADAAKTETGKERQSKKRKGRKGVGEQ